MLSSTWQGGRRGLMMAAGVYLANAVVAAWVAMSHDIPGRPFGIESGLPMAWDSALGLGAGLSAPLAMLIALAILTASVARGQSRRSSAAIGISAGGFPVPAPSQTCHNRG